LIAALLVGSAATWQLLTGPTAAQTEQPQKPPNIGGVIQDERGLPVANAKITLTSQGFTSSTLTSADGRYEFTNLAPATYRLTVEADRFRKEVVTIPLTRPDEVIAQQPIKLAPSSLHVAVFDSNNQPLRGVSVSLYGREQGVAGPAVERKITDDSGDAYFGRLSPGSYQLSANLRGYDEYRNVVFISSDRRTEFPFQLSVAPVIPINEKAVTRYGVPNLPSKNVQAIFQDSEGWVWFGTDRGIARFNGADFKSSSAGGSGYEYLAGEDVRSIIEDREGMIWLATSRGVRRLSKDGADLTLLLDNADVHHLSLDSQGNVWAATGGGALKYDGESFSPFTSSQGLPSNEVRAIAEDRRGRLWIVTQGGVAIVEGERITPFDLKRAADAQASRRPADTSAITDVRGIFVDGNGSVWFASAQGVFFLTPDATAVTPVDALRILSGADSSPGARAIGQDQNGRMWFAMDSGGVALYDPASRELQRIAFLDRDHVTSLFMGREGHLWFATDNGAVYSDFYSFVNYSSSRGLPDNNVHAVIELPRGAGRDQSPRLLALTSAGVSRLEGERFVPVEPFRAGINVRAVTLDRSGDAWFATEQGALRLSGQSITQFSDNQIASNNVRWVMGVDSGAAVIFCTTRGATIFQGGEFKAIAALAGYDVRHAFEDADGWIWFSTERGVVGYDLKSSQSEVINTSTGLADNDARWVARLGDRLLIATGAGVQSFSVRGGRPVSFAVFDGEPTRTMFVDREGYLWTGTDEGQVKKFILVGGQIVSTVYSGEANALTAGQINSISEDGRGRIWIATDKGAVRHIPVRVAPPAEVSVEINGQAGAVSEAGGYEIPYGRHRVTFHFAAVSMSGPVRYLYRISSEASAATWEALPLQQGVERDVSRFDMDEGAHTFELIAINRDLYGAATPVASVMLRVGSPFWKNWWFFTLALAVIGMAAGAAFAAHRARTREYVLPKHLRSYVPIEPNPYIVGNPIRTEKMFYGREDDFRYVRTKLEGVNQGVVIVFCGERRTGKSSILYQVLNGRLGERFIPVFVDLQEMVVASDSEFFARISRLISEAVARADARRVETVSSAPADRLESDKLDELSGATVATGTQVGAHKITVARSASSRLVVPAFDGRNPYPVFLDFLDDVLSVIGDRALLILMDEYELMEGKVDEGKLSPELFTFLAGLMDNKERLALIFTGSRRLEERDKKYWRELLRRSLFRKVGFLSEKDALRLITEPVVNRLVYGRGVVDAIYRLTAGHPFYTQVICQNTVDYINEHKQNWMTLSDLRHVIADIVDNPLPQMIYTWDALSDDEKLVLSLLAGALEDGNAYATAYELRASVKMNEYPVHLSENTIRLTLEEMFRREILEKNSTDGFLFKIDLFRLWIRRSHSIWQVVKEVRTL
jgi:ligand-binding sensor domain-containing protein/AAA+ ATPase superfamily predicted ATPase